MKLLSITIFDESFNEILHKSLQNKVDQRMMNRIASFLQGLEAFGNESFGVKFTRVELENLWFDFLHIDGYVIMTTVETELEVSDNVTFVYNSIIREIESFVKEMLLEQNYTLNSDEEKNFVADFLDMKINAIQLGIKSLNIPDLEPFNPNFIADMLLVCEESGLPITHKEYSDKKYDEYLTSMMFSSLSTFSQSEFEKNMTMIHFGGYKLCFRAIDDLLLILTFESKARESKIVPDIARKKAEMILLNLNRNLNFLTKETSHAVFQMIEEFIPLGTNL